MVRRGHLLLVVAAAALHAPKTTTTTEARVAQASPHRLPIRFEANVGQWDPHVRFVARGTMPVFITDTGVTFGGRDAPVTLALVGEVPSVPRGEDELVTKSNFFLGNDPARWHTDVSNYARVRAPGVVPGVDVVWHGDEQGLEYDLVASAGVDARALTVQIDGATANDVTAEGSLAITTDAGVLLQRPPRVTQGVRDLAARFVRRDATHFGFAIDGYDAMQAVLIDPVFAYSTYLGGSGSDNANSIAVDASGSVYVAGLTDSSDFPTAYAFQSTYGGNGDAFVAKLNAAGSALVYATYVGGNMGDQALGLAVDTSGDAYITGTTSSTDFPTYAAFQSSTDGDTAFVTKLDATGSALVFSSYLGGNGEDVANGIAVDPSGNAYVTGYTSSTNFPIVSAFQSTLAGGVDAFVTEVSPAGSLVHSTYLGGSDDDEAHAMAVDGAGAAYIVGITDSSDFPTQVPLQAANASNGYTGFVSKLDASGSSLAYSTYLGGSAGASATGVVVDASGDVYVTGYTSSLDFPTHDAVQAMNAGASDVFVTELNASASALVYSTYLGGANEDVGYAIAISASGYAYVTGYTTSVDFPLARPMQTTRDGNNDAFVAVIAPVGLGLFDSTYLGGSNDDEGFGIAVDSSENVYVTGWTASFDFPTQSALQPVYGGVLDAFISKIVVPNLGQGTPCTSAGECASNLCADGVCCNTACTAQCEACDVTGQVGTCTSVVGTPHGARQTCNGAGVCGGSCDGAHATCTYGGPTTACGSTCSDAFEVDSVCDGDGGCVAQPPFSCNDFACTGDARCNTVCLTNLDCVSGSQCFNGECAPPAECVNDHRSQRSDGTTADCTPYACNASSGLCNAICGTNDDCVAGWVCTGGEDPPKAGRQPEGSSGECVLPPYPGGCSVGTSDESQPWLVALLALVLASRRNRTSTT
jgi:MYXO-CTERM domain-containing protein